MIDWLLRTVTGWQEDLQRRRVEGRIQAAEAHLKSALTEMYCIPGYAAQRVNVARAVRASLAELVRYKHARGMVKSEDMLKTIVDTVRGVG